MDRCGEIYKIKDYLWRRTSAMLMGMIRPSHSAATANVVTGAFPNAVAICESLHKECLALVAVSLDSTSRREHQEIVTLVLAVAQLAHTQMSLIKLDSPHAMDMSTALARSCEVARRALEGRSEDQQRSAGSALTSLLALAERTFRS